VLRTTTAVPSQYNSVDNFVSSTTINSVPLQTSDNSIEVNQLNAFFSGTEPIEYTRHTFPYNVSSMWYDGVPFPPPETWKIVSMDLVSAVFDVETAWKDLYYAKYPGIGTANPGSNRLNYNVYKHIADLNDVFANPPLTSPSASSGSAPTTPGNALLRVLPYKAKIGTVDTVSTSGVIITDWQTYVTGATDYATTGTFTTTMAANMIYIGTAVTASVTGVQFGAATSYDLTLEFSRLLGTPSPGDDVFLHSWVPLVSDVSGAYLNNTSYNPISIDMPVTTTGTIKNIKAWVEFIHDYRVSGTSEVTNAKRGLKNIQVALRSPNTNFQTSHPLWNGHLSFPLRTSATLTGVAQQFGNDYYDVPSLLRNSYLLWDGHGVEDGLVDSLTDADIASAYHEFDRDIDMRTVFWDGAPDKNPRDVSALLGDATQLSPGVPTHPYSWLGTAEGGLFYKSPTWGARANGVAGYLVPTLGGAVDLPVSGAQVPWMIDYRLNLCGLENPTARLGLTESFGARPPGGWISGRGGLVPWQYTQNDVLTNPDALPPGYGGRVFIRPSTKAMHVLGGSVKTPGYLGSGSWYVNYEADENAGTFTLDPANTGLILNSTTVPMQFAGADLGPSPAIDTSVNYYNVSIGDGGIAGGNTERVLMIGGSSASFVNNKVYMGHWDTPGVEDITWDYVGVVPSGVTRHYSTVIDDKVYVAGGEKTGGTSFTGVFTGTIDQNSGYVASWSEKLFPSTTTRLVTKMIQMITWSTVYSQPLTSSDAGTTFIRPPIGLSLVTGTAPGVAHTDVVNVRSKQYFVTAGNYWATTLDDGTTWWTGSMTGTYQTANAVCSASSGKVYTAGSAIMNATPPTVFGQSINWAKNVDLVPRTTGAPTQIHSWSPGLLTNSEDALVQFASEAVAITDRNSRVSSQLYLEFSDPVYVRTRNLIAAFQYRSNGGAWVTLSSQTDDFTDADLSTWLFDNIEMPDLTNIEVRYLFTLSDITNMFHDNDSTFTISFNVGQPLRAWRPDVTLNAIASGGLAGSGYLTAVGISTSTVGAWKSDAAMTTWTHSRIGLDGDNFVGIAYGNGIWLAVGSRGVNGIVARSTDGATWTVQSLAPQSAVVAVAFANGKFVILGTRNNVYTTTDGITLSTHVCNGDYYTLFYDVNWNGTKFIAVGKEYGYYGGYWGPAGYPTGLVTWYSTDGSTWTRGILNIAFGSLGGNSKLASYVDEVPVVLGNTHWSFFDSIPDQTGTIQKFGWTTFMDTGTGVMSTFRYKLDPLSPTWQLQSDAGIVELVTSNTNHYPPVVDDKHRVWIFDGTSSKYSQLSWDHANERVNMSPLVPSNFGQSRGNLDVSVSMSITFASGVLFSLNQGTSTPQVAATAFVGPAPESDEFNTIGAQLGPSSIQPVYPMLNDIAVVKIVDSVDAAAATSNNSQFVLSSPRVEIAGTRPGLMGTECGGIWNFLFGTKASNFDAVTGYAARNESGIWVRQVRLELLTNLRMSTHEQLVSKNKRFDKSSHVIAKDGPHRIAIQSGSAAWDTGVNYVYVNQVSEYGRAIGITSDVNSLPDYAVLTFITGNLYDQLVNEGVTDPSHPSWFLSYPSSDVVRPVGIPYIPDSYMVAGTGTAEQVDASASKDLINSTVGIQTTVPNANIMTDFLNRQGYTKTMFRRWEETIAAQSSGSSSYYFPGLP
jgi:hypothetical protein